MVGATGAMFLEKALEAALLLNQPLMEPSEQLTQSRLEQVVLLLQMEAILFLARSLRQVVDMVMQA